jgi:hypothetical protein
MNEFTICKHLLLYSATREGDTKQCYLLFASYKHQSTVCNCVSYLMVPTKTHTQSEAHRSNINIIVTLFLYYVPNVLLLFNEALASHL